MNIDIAFLVFVAVAWLPFRYCRPASAVAIVFFGGWLLLPVGHYPASPAEGGFPFWIVGLAVPSDMLLTKAWIAPATALLGAALFDGATLRSCRPRWFDAPIAAWCAWPLMQSLLALATSGVDSRPPGWLASLYVVGCWGVPWLLGRIYFARREGGLLLARAMTLSALACLPVALIEGVAGPTLYRFFYEPHPLQADGAARYLGFRPLGFFEHGNQYGIWISLSALAAVWLALACRGERFATAWRVTAAVIVAMALAAQSLGAVLMLAAGTAFLALCRHLRPRASAIALVAVLVVGGAVYVSGIVPVMRIGKDTAIGRQVVDAIRATGRGSFAWRISQDQKLLADAREHLMVGSARWDWWRPKATRPWGLTMLLLGQFGVVGLALALGSLLWPALRIAWLVPRASGWRVEALPLMLTTIVVMATLDGLLNSFFYFPAIVAAGALARSAGMGRARGEVVRVPARAA